MPICDLMGDNVPVPLLHVVPHLSPPVPSYLCNCCLIKIKLIIQFLATFLGQKQIQSSFTLHPCYLFPSVSSLHADLSNDDELLDVPHIECTDVRAVSLLSSNSWQEKMKKSVDFIPFLFSLFVFLKMSDAISPFGCLVHTRF